MKSYKTIILSDKIILFNYIDGMIYITITYNDNIINHTTWSNYFIDILDDLKNEYFINIHSIELIKRWFYKNENKTNPPQKYTTRYGRTILYK